jgi:phosphoribosylamine--glycine ligase
VKLLIIDPEGNGLDLAVRAQRDGHSVKMFIRQTPKTAYIGRGFVELVNDFQSHLGWADIVFLTDNTLYLRELDNYRAKGGSVIGPTSDTAQWELDREIGMDIFTSHGIDVPEYKEFTSYEKAIAYVRKENRPFVSKSSGNADKALSYVAKSPADLVYMLDRWRKLGKSQGPFILQELVHGCEMAVGCWVGRQGFASPWCENFEFKKLCNQDLGCNTGEQGTVLRYVEKSKLANIVLKPLEDALVAENYSGYIDVNCIIDDAGKPWPLEFTMRPGWPTMQIQEPLHETDMIEWLATLLTSSRRDRRAILTDCLSMGVVLSIPDYPYSHLTKKEVVGVPIYGMKPSLTDHVHPCEMMMSETFAEEGGHVVKKWMPATGGDYVLTMTAIGDTVRECQQTVYRRLRSLEVPNSPMYRTDIGTRLRRELPKLQSMGFATGMIFSLSN